MSAVSGPARETPRSRGCCIALFVYFCHVLTSTWRWHLLLTAQNVHVPQRDLLSSLLVSYFFNNFLPSNIGGDVVRIRDTARPARSKTLATLVILVDRVMGVIGLFLVAAIAATVASETRGVSRLAHPSVLAVGDALCRRGGRRPGGALAGGARPPADDR